jgi:hypothetical protein
VLFVGSQFMVLGAIGSGLLERRLALGDRFFVMSNVVWLL